MSDDLLDLHAADACGNKTDDAGNCTHPAKKDFNIHLGQFEADSLKKYDPNIFDKLEKAGVRIVKVDLDDIDLVGKLVDEVLAQIGKKPGDPHDYLYKHAMSNRLKSTLISIKGFSTEVRSTKCATIFGHGIYFYDN